MFFKNLYFVLVPIILIGLLWVFYTFNPAEYRFFPRCPFHLLTGLDCPGCGSQRAVYHLLHGNFSDAIKNNVLLVICVPLLMVHLSYKVKSLWYKKDDSWEMIYYPVTPKIIFGVVLLFWILRNIPVVPFSYLAANH